MATAKPQHRAGLYRVFLAAMVCAFGLFLSLPAAAQMDSDFSAGGAVRIGDSATTCNAAATGALRYNSAGLSVSYCNGSAWTVIGTGQSFLSLTDTPASYAGAAGYFLKVNAATNAVEFTNQLVTSGTGATPVGMLLDNLDDVIITTPTNGQSLTYNGTNWVNSAAGGSIDGLSDGITDYVTDMTLGLGDTALDSNTTGAGNTAVGINALTANTDGDQNTAVGYKTLESNVSGDMNTAVGHQALKAGGSNNVAIGYLALLVNTGQYNTAVGTQAMEGNIVGQQNTALGQGALYSTNASNNTGVGTNALYSNVAKTESTAVGYNAMYYADSTATGAVSYNTALGAYALRGSATASSNTGTYNTAIGHSTLIAATSGGNNIGIGPLALKTLTTGTDNIAIGRQALEDVPVGTLRNIAIGTSAGDNSTGDDNIYIGYAVRSGSGTTTGGQNVIIGNDSLRYTNGAGNSVLGYSAGGAVNAGLSVDNMVAVGRQALGAVTDGDDNVAVGVQALALTTTGYNNVAMGTQALNANIAKRESTAIGYRAMRNADSTAVGAITYNTALGAYALQGSGTASANTGVGNTAIGHSALLNVTAGGGNTALGYNAGNAGTAITTGTNNTFIGYQAQADANNYTNGTAIGNGAILTASNRIVLGNASIASIYAQVTTLTGISDRRHKKDIEDIDLGLEFISKLKPVAYRFNNGDETLRYGFIAQDIEMALSPELQKMAETTDQEHGLALLSRENNDERTYRVNYGELTGPMVKAIQEQQAIIDTQRIRIEDQEARLDKLSKDLDSKMASFEKDLKGLKAHTGYDINKAGMEYWMLLLMVGLFGAFSATFVIGTVIRTRKV